MQAVSKRPGAARLILILEISTPRSLNLGYSVMKIGPKYNNKIWMNFGTNRHKGQILTCPLPCFFLFPTNGLELELSDSESERYEELCMLGESKESSIMEQ